MNQYPYIEEWLDTLKASGRKEITIKTYRKDVIQCLNVLEKDGRPTSPYEIRPEDFVYLRNNLPQKEETRRSYMRILALWIVHYTGKDPMKSANLLFNREQRNRVFINDMDFQKLYDNANPTMRMVIILGGMMGLRRAEICNIKDDDIRGHFLTVKGKGHGDGLVVKLRMPDLVQEEIVRYRQWKATKPNSGDGYLIQNGNPLSKASVSAMSSRFRTFANKVEVNATVHSLRRYYAMTLYEETNSDIITVAKLMRHADVSTTSRCYLSASDTREREAISKVNDHVSCLLGQNPAQEQGTASPTPNHEQGCRSG